MLRVCRLRRQTHSAVSDWKTLLTITRWAIWQGQICREGVGFSQRPLAACENLEAALVRQFLVVVGTVM
jgi:hypothetical protein